MSGHVGGATPRTPWRVLLHPDVVGERSALSDRERLALDTAIEKLAALGPELPFPHSSAVQGVVGGNRRELRPRGGRSPTRAIYGRFGHVIVILAIGPEAEADRRGFAACVAEADLRAREIQT